MESMETSTVAMLVERFNTVSIIALVMFVIFGAVAIFLRVSAGRRLSGGKGGGKGEKGVPRPVPPLLWASCAAVLAAFAVEATVFNFQRYMKIFAGPELHTLNGSPDNPDVVMTSDGGSAAVVLEKDEEQRDLIGVLFKGIDMKITSIFVDIKFGGTETKEMIVSWADGLSCTNRFTKRLHKRIPYDNYTPIQPYGNITELKVMFVMDGPDRTIEMEQIALNRQIPFYFSGLRLIVVSFFAFCVFCCLWRGARSAAAYYLFEYKFNPVGRRQSLLYVFSVILLMLFSYLCINTSYSKSYMANPVHRQYNEYLIDALMRGRAWLDYGTPENLLKAERPYDNAYRMANGYKFGSDVMWDWAWYKGKWYCYYGVVPAVVVFLPYKLVTGEYLSNNGGIFLFTSVIIILTAMLWRFCVKKYMPNAGFAFYMLSFFTLFFASGVYAQLRFTRFYSIAQTSGLCFALGGVYLLLKSVENGSVGRLKVFFACFLLACVAGCRPSMIFVSLLVPIVLWKYRSRRLLPFVALPYLAVAIPLCAYNYVRFDSIFEFGMNYVTGEYNPMGSALIVPFGRVIKVFTAFASFLLTPAQYSLYFPFVSGYPYKDVYVMGMYNMVKPGVGLVNFPIVYCLAYPFINILSNKRPAGSGAIRYVLYGFIVVAAVTAICDSLMVGFQGRYLLDFAFFAILPSLFCAYEWCGAGCGKNRLAAVYVLLVASIFVGAFLCVNGVFVSGTPGEECFDPALYRYLQYSLGILRDV